MDSIMSPRALWEVYYQPFIGAVEAGAAGGYSTCSLTAWECSELLITGKDHHV